MNRAQPDLVVLHEIYRAARENLSAETWDYLTGAAETETTLKRNRLALDSLAFRPRVLRDVSEIDCSTVLLGQRMRIPVFLAPIGSLQDLHAEAGAAAARGRDPGLVELRGQLDRSLVRADQELDLALGRAVDREHAPREPLVIAIGAHGVAKRRVFVI